MKRGAKKKSGKSKKKSPKKKAVESEEILEASSEDVLESVSEKMEMADKAMDFFESDEEAAPEELDAAISEAPEDAEEVLASEESEDSIEMAELADGEEVEALEASAEDEEEAMEASESEASDVDEDGQQELIASEPQEEGEFIDDEQLVSVLESVLFASDRPVGIGIFKNVFKGTPVKSKDIKKGLEDLQSQYAEASRGVTLEEIGSGWQLRTKVDNVPFLMKLGKVKPFKLSGPALEVLSILAYKQPLVKSEVDHIRGVESGHLVRALMDRGLVSFQGKSELPGKPMQYGTTRKFLEIFGLRNLKELPSLEEIDQLLPDGIGYDGEEEKLSDVTDSMSEEIGDKYSEGEEELDKITAKLGDIDTSSEFFEQEKIRQREKREREKARDIREAVDLGEDVETKDVRWLERYDQKIAEQELAAGEPGALVAEAQGVEGSNEPEVPLSDELMALTEDASSVEMGETSPLENDGEASEDSVAEEGMLASDDHGELRGEDQNLEEASSEDVLLVSEAGDLDFVDSPEGDVAKGLAEIDPFGDMEA